MIIGLFPELLAPGGVQRAGRHVAAVTAQFAGDREAPCQFLSLNDPHGIHIVCVGTHKFSVSGFARNKLKFVFAAMRAAGDGPSIVIGLHPNLAPIIGAMRLRARKFRSIVFAHGIEVWQPLGWPRAAALRSADLVLGPSTDTVQHLISQQGVQPAKSQRLPWGIDPEFQARVAAQASSILPAAFPRKGKIILAVGRWDASEKYKGADTLINSLPRVLQSIPNTSLVLVGDGNDRPRLEQLARDNGVFGQTYFLHDLSQNELFACYAACDVFALPSRGEGFGLVFLEAMAHAKPVIGGAHGGTPDVIEDGVTGILVPHGNIEILSSSIASLLSDPIRTKRMGTLGKERVERLFSFEQFQARLVRVLEDFFPRKR